VGHFKGNLLVQFSVVSFLITLTLAVVISTMLSGRLDHAINLLKFNNAALERGIALGQASPISIQSITREVSNLRWITYGAIGGGFVILYAGLVGIVWRGWNTIVRQGRQLQAVNAELQRSVSELGESNLQLEAFSYSVSHDLRAPLRSIDGFSQALLEDYAVKLDNQGKDYLRRVRGASQRMGQLIDDMLNLSRVTRAEMRRETVDLSALAQTVTAELKKAQPERDVTFVSEEGLVANGDEALLRVVLENLLGNAWKFTGKQPQARIEFGAIQHNGLMAYMVRDNGAGFDMAYAGKLFTPFQRLHGVAEYEGTGIGLATVQRIVRRHGGSVWAEGAVGQGATFYFTLN
jgi:light-regulated signal transduction histidine kinase (bacteriophytochrome)